VEAGQGQNKGNDTTTGDVQGGAPWWGRRRGLLIGGAISLGLLFLTVIAIALVLIVGSGAGGGRGGGSAAAPEAFQEKYVSGQGADKIAVLPVVGAIGPEGSNTIGTQMVTPETLRNQLRQAERDERVKAVVLEVNSPGGAVVASDRMHESIQEFEETTEKPVVVSMGETAASGGYYIATAADQIVANENTLTGSLGVIFTILNYEEAEEKLGLEQEVYKSSEYKDIFSGSSDRSPEEQEIIQGLIDESYDRFVEVIVEGRGLPENEVRELADGRVYSGLQAESLGLVDALGNLDHAAEVASDLAGVEEATVVRYERVRGLAELLRARLAPSESEALKVLKAAGLSTAPELQYLYRP
jgi:protease IV